MQIRRKGASEEKRMVDEAWISAESTDTLGLKIITEEAWIWRPYH